MAGATVEAVVCSDCGYHALKGMSIDKAGGEYGLSIDIIRDPGGYYINS